MKRLIAALTAALMVLAFAGTALAAQPAAPGQNKLTCSVDAPATCTTNGKTATIDTTLGGAAAVYLPGFNNSFYGVRVGQVTKLSNTYTGTAGIDPRWSVPIDLGGIHDGYTDYFVFVTLAECNNGFGLVDVINDTTCTIHRNDSSVTYPNWLAYTQANSSDYISLNDFYAFVIADGSGAPGVWTISNFTVGKPGK